MSVVIKWICRVLGTGETDSVPNLWRRNNTEEQSVAARQSSQRRPCDWSPPKKLSDFPLPAGWEFHIDPYGEPYFYNKSWKAVTRNCVAHPNELMQLKVEYDLMIMDQKKYMNPLNDYEMHIGFNIHNGSMVNYAMLDHTFCLNIAIEGWHVNDLPVAPYWCSIAEFPMHRPLPWGVEELSVEESVLSALVYGAAENIMGHEKRTSVLSQYLKAISMFRTLRKETSENGQFVKAMRVRGWIVARMKAEFLNKGPFDGDRFRGSTVALPMGSPSWKQRLLDMCLLFLCFGVHRRYQRRFWRSYTNEGLVHITIFRRSLAETLQEWSDIKLMGTVFIFVNMTALALSQSLLTKIEQALIFMSAFFAMASVVDCIYSTWIHRTNTEANIYQCFRYLRRKQGRRNGLLYTSMFLCFPLALLLWSIVTFAAAISHLSIHSFRNVSIGYIPMAALTVNCAILSSFLYRLWKTSSGAFFVLKMWRVVHGRRNNRGFSDIETARS